MSRDAVTGVGARPGVTVVVVTGSESTGKTSLAGALARRYGTTWVPEYARTYADEKEAITGRLLDADDVDPIARGHVARADAAIANARGLVIFDQDLVSTVVYARHYYGSCPSWIEQAAVERRGDLYLLAAVDVPWVADPRRDRPHQREELHRLFEDTLRSLGARYVTLRGTWEERESAAIAAIDARR